MGKGPTVLTGWRSYCLGKRMTGGWPLRGEGGGLNVGYYDLGWWSDVGWGSGDAQGGDGSVIKGFRMGG